MILWVVVVQWKCVAFFFFCVFVLFVVCASVCVWFYVKRKTTLNAWMKSPLDVMWLMMAVLCWPDYTPPFGTVARRDLSLSLSVCLSQKHIDRFLICHYIGKCSFRYCVYACVCDLYIPFKRLNRQASERKEKKSTVRSLNYFSEAKKKH